MKSYNVSEQQFGKTGYGQIPGWMKGGIFDQMGDRVKMKQDLMRKSYQVSTQRDTLM